MIRFDSYRVLIIDQDQVFSKKIMKELIRLGGSASTTVSFEKGKALFRVNDFDLILAPSFLNGEKFESFVSWHQESIGEDGFFAVLGEGARKEASALDYVDRTLPFNELIETINRLLFDFKEFEKNLASMGDSNGLSIEMTIDQKCYPVKPIEFNQNSLLISAEKNFAPGTIARVKITFHDFPDSEIFSLTGVMGKPQNEGQMFQVDSTFTDNWNAVKKYLTERQQSITRFMNKVAGI